MTIRMLLTVQVDPTQVKDANLRSVIEARMADAPKYLDGVAAVRITDADALPMVLRQLSAEYGDVREAIESFSWCRVQLRTLVGEEG